MMKPSPLKVGLLGYGKMGQAIESLAADHNATIVWRIGQSARDSLTTELLQSADVVIEFSRPEAAWSNVQACIQAGIPIVCGTTGWQAHLEQAKELCIQKNGAFLWASNFSVGVNLFFALNRYLADLMLHRPEYAPFLKEIHHIHKLDAPSGTAVTLAEDLIAHSDHLQQWQLIPSEPNPAVLSIEAIRTGEVPGTHIIGWKSAVDELVIEHKAHSRIGFAQGALLAAMWLHDKKGVFTMADVLSVR